MGHGELYVMTIGLLPILVLCANSLVTVEVLLPTMVQEMVKLSIVFVTELLLLYLVHYVIRLEKLAIDLS